MQLQDNSSLLLTQSTCALDVVITVPYVNPGEPLHHDFTSLQVCIMKGEVLIFDSHVFSETVSSIASLHIVNHTYI